MVEGGGGESGGRVTTSYEAAGGRQRFTVELRPGETTIVSWKKLLKDATVTNGPGPLPTSSSFAAAAPAAAPAGSHPQPPPPPPHPSLDSCLAPGQPVENELKDAPPGSRLNAVIERIERLYVGKQSDDEEDLNDVPDDDEYDTEDSFIDDTELDEYFQVDNSAIKHDGFFVNRGKLERISEPTSLPNQQPKKRRRKDLAKGHDGNDDASKHTKVAKKAGKAVPFAGKDSASPSHGLAVTDAHFEDLKMQNQVNTSEILVKKKAKSSSDAPVVGFSNGDAIVQDNNVDQQKAGVIASKNPVNKLRESCELSDASSQRLNDKSSYSQEKSQTGVSINHVDGLDQCLKQREKSTMRDERSDASVAEGKNFLQTSKVPLMPKREGSSVRPKSSMLEKAIRELEKIVAESRPPTVEVQDADNSSQSVKRRLPPEIKQKLAKVARFAASHGKISKELINRLMSIVGHLVQLRTLKRNLKIMINMGLSAKQEKDDRVQLVKKEVAEMVRIRVPLMKPKELAGTSDDFQESATEEKEAFKRKYSMDDALEDKICDLYDLYVEGLEEDAGPQVRKLYAELAALWPNGFMDNHGIKRAICRAKDRRRALNSRHKDRQKIKRHKMLASKTETARVDINAQAQLPHVHEKLVSGATDHGLSASQKSVPCITTSITAVKMPVNFPNGPNMDRQKQEKVKGSSGTSGDTRATDALPKKKVKKKPELDLNESIFRPEKANSSHGEEKHKSHKQPGGPLPKPNPQSVAPSYEQLS